VRLDNLKLNWTVDETVTDENAVGGIGVAVQDGTLRISNSEITVDGDGGRSGRYAVAAYGTATMVVNNTTIEQTGRNEKTAVIPEAPSNEALLISGNARANFSIGNTETYYFNSTCIAEGWAALSTDSAQGDGLDLYAYNTTAIAQNGGYGIYADTDCRDRLYGCTLKSAEVGAIISNNGSITLADGTAANDVVLENGEKLMSYNEGDSSQTDGTLLQGGRNAVMMHAPDMMGQGKASSNTADFSATNSTLSTTKDLVSTKDYSDYGEAVGEYVDFISGADILVKSTSANINLDNVTMESYSNTLVETVINADSMGNFLAEGDGNEVNPVTVNMSNMTATGDILHYDYQRRMSVNLSNTTLNGAIVSGTIDTWKGIWSKYQTGEVNWLPNDTYATTYGAALTLSGNSVWNVTGESTLSSLTVEAGSTINGTVTVDGKEVTPEAGKTYTGSIVVTKKAEATTVAKVKGVKATSAKSGKLTVKYTKLAQADGYQIQYSTNKNFKNSVSKTTVKKSVTSKTLKVKAGKKYYVRVRAYVKASDGSKVYGAFSKTANVKVKK
jgi:hypothetical protein